MITLEAKAEPGQTFDEVYPTALRVAQALGTQVRFKFNDLECTATPKGDVALALKLYGQATENKESIHYKMKCIKC